MATFSYRARNANGELITGDCNAINADRAADQLLAEGLIPIEIKAAHLKDNNLKFSLNFTIQKKVSTEELLIFCRQMYSLTKASVPVLSAVTRLAQILQNPPLVNALKGIQAKISMGEALSSAMLNYPNVFPDLMIKLVESGEANGRIDEAFLLASDHFELAEATKKRVKAAFRYPLIVIFSIVVAMVVINIFVVPRFAQLFASFKAQLPLPTRILIGTSTFIKIYWPYLLIFIIIIYAGIRYALTKKNVKEKWAYYQLKIPVLGELREKMIMADFSRTLALLLKAGIPIIKALTLVAHVVNNEYAQKKILSIRSMIERGQNLTQAAIEVKLFTPLVLQMLAVGEETGSTDQVLNEVAAYYEREIDYGIKKIADRIEPILLVLVAGMVLILALGVFLPMWDMVNIVK